MKSQLKPNYLFSNRDLVSLILPLILEQTLAITVGMADTMMVASVGEAGVSGVSLMDMVNNLIFSVLPRWQPAAQWLRASIWAATVRLRQGTQQNRCCLRFLLPL